MKNIVVYGITEAKGTTQIKRCTEDRNEIQRIFQEYCEIDLGEEDVEKVICLGKFEETKKRDLY